jgi:hypothetical protein
MAQQFAMIPLGEWERVRRRAMRPLRFSDAFEVSDSDSAISVNLRQKRQEQQPASSQIIERGIEAVRVVSAAPGGGKYYGKVYGLPTGTLSDEGTLAASDLGIDRGDCLIFNAAEVGRDTHDLTAGTPTQTIYIARYLGSTGGYTPMATYMIGSFAASTEELQVITDITGATLDCDTKDIDITATRVTRRVLVTEPPES